MSSIIIRMRYSVLVMVAFSVIMIIYQVCSIKYASGCADSATPTRCLRSLRATSSGRRVCMHVSMRACVCDARAYAHAHTHTLSLTHTHAHALAHTHTRTHTHMHTRTGQPFDFTKVYSFGEARHKYYRLYSKRTHSIVREHIL